MASDLLIDNARIVTPGGTYEGCVRVDAGQISAITQRGEGGAARREIDAGGRFLLPGMVDEHVHMMDPGFTDREDWTTGTKAAARGGVTTVIDHHRSEPLVYTREILEEKAAYVDSRAVVDFGQLGGLDVDNLAHLRPMWEGGALGFKGFMCELHGVPDLSEGVLMNIMREARMFGATVMLHCESDSILKKSKERIDAEDRTDYMCVSDWRNPESEYVATMDAVALAELTGCTVLVAHVSQPDLLEAIQAARARGARIFAESCPQYFYLDHSHLAEMGPFVKFTPVIRSAETREGMREALGRDMVDSIGTDHCPFPRGRKEDGLENIHEAPFGIPGVETTVRLMLNAVNEGLLTLNQMVRICCETPARIFNIYPQKGCLQAGADADLIIVDMEREETLRDADVVSKCGWTPFDGWEVKGAPEVTISRGVVVMEDGVVTGQAGHGRVVTRTESA